MPEASSRVVRPILPIWRRALGDTSGATFAEVVAPHVRLEGSIYAAPIDGRDKVWAAMRTAADITDTLSFTHESTAQDRSYLEWEQEGLAQRINGVTVLTFDDAGLIVNVALHHRPLGAVLAYSAEMGRRLGNSVGSDVFYQVPTSVDACLSPKRRLIMITHRFAEAAERRDGAAMAALFAEDVTYHTPTLTTDLHGKELTLRYLAAGTRIVDDLQYTDQVSDDERLILFWKGILAQREISGATVLAGESGGLIRDITVLQRPWGVTANFRDGILPALADAVPPSAWQLDDRKTPASDPDAGAGQRPGGPLSLAPDVALHSAILTKTLQGRENVQAYHEVIGAIQGPRAYLARFASAGRLVEYWNCVIDGHLEQGIDDYKLDGNGRVTDQTVWLRPWPVVTVLRDRAIAAGLPFLPADYWRLPAGPSQLP